MEVFAERKKKDITIGAQKKGFERGAPLTIKSIDNVH
jgi:hypothetical protein